MNIDLQQQANKFIDQHEKKLREKQQVRRPPPHDFSYVEDIFSAIRVLIDR